MRKDKLQLKKFLVGKMQKIKCPECGGRAVKCGFKPSRQGRKQRYQCVSCARVFILRENEDK